jgi:DNA-binding protein HU-beta
MTKAEIVAEIATKTGIEKQTVQHTVESFMDVVKGAMVNGENVYLRGFGSFVIKKRAEKTGRNISKNTTIIIPAHNIPAFKPAKSFVSEVKNHVK